jgi:hypothetical protein
MTTNVGEVVAGKELSFSAGGKQYGGSSEN